MIRRAAPAVAEWSEELRQIVGTADVAIDLQFDEFRLLATVRARPVGAGLPAPTVDVAAALTRIAQVLARRYYCAVRLSDGSNATFVFEH